MDLKERNFEQDIESFLISPEGGYHKGDQSDYDKLNAVDLKTLIKFIDITQSKTWERFTSAYGIDAERALLNLFNNQVNANGVLYVLKNGLSDVKLHGTKIYVAYLKRPESGKNPDLEAKYNANIMTCIRQFSYSAQNKNTIDMVLSINGIPIVAIELKNQFTGQSVDNGKKQWMYDRDPKETIFIPDRRILAYFTADLYEVWMTTKLAKENTTFLPFNQGSSGAGNVGGKGNPSRDDDYVTAYFWNNVLQKDKLLDILQKYIYVTKDGNQRKVVFPRYHQLDVVTKVLADVKEKGSGHNYLVNHSAGSGKSNSIAWLAYRLASLHDDNDNGIFRSVIVVTDRRVLDSQIQGTIMSIEHTAGLVEPIDDKKSAKDLRDAINSGKKIIITTLQKFPVIYQEIEDNGGRNFAVIIDEAHSSQTGTAARKLKAGLADTAEALREYAEIEAEAEDSIKDESEIDAKIIKEMLSHGQHKNLSFFAFTATPKQKTLEMFGTRNPVDGMYYPFHIYSMRQAIEENFIFDVLQNYTTYRNFYQVVKTTPENPEVPVSPARKAVKRYESFHPYVLRQKTEVMVEQFRELTMKKIGGKAKAMVVTSSRLHAVRYFQEFKKYIEEMKYDFDVLVAFSGAVNFEQNEYTETNLNGLPESQTKQTFHGDEFHMLIVAEKYQTGFDEPLLHTMFVDKKLDGVKAVQTLSRVNRICPGKTDTFILDFVNEAEDIQNAFKPFYETVILRDHVDPNLIYTYKAEMEQLYMFNHDDVVRFCDVYFKSGAQSAKDMGRVSGILKPIIDRYNDATDETKYKFRLAVKSFNGLYSYILQMTRLFDKDLHKLYTFTNYLSRIIPYDKVEKIELDDQLKLQYSSLKETFSGSLSIDEVTDEERIINPPEKSPLVPPNKEKDLLEEIIRKINETYKGQFTEGDKVMVETLFARCNSEEHKSLKNHARHNDSEMFVKTIFPKEFEKVALKCYEEQMGAFAKLHENQEFYNEIMYEMGKEIYKALRV